jgi:parvulin-like peptidyl-prolyl isomerase
LTKIGAGASFEDLAREYSDGPTSVRGGSLGVFQAGRMAPAFEKAVAGLEVGAITSAPVETPFGFHVIRRDAAEMLGAKHVLVQYKGSSRAKPEITRTKEEAKARAEEVLAKAKTGEDFGALAAEYSDGPTSTRGGDLGAFKSGDMIEPFEVGMKEVEPGNLVPRVVETMFGFHVIYRTR